MSDTDLRNALRLDQGATGYGAVIEGVLDIRTVSDTRNSTALNTFGVRGFRILSTCNDPDCMCKVELLKQHFPDISIVPVTITRGQS